MSAPTVRQEYTIHAAVAFLGVLPALLHPGAIVGDGVDAFGTYWFYWWTRFCIEHFGDPSATNLFFYPLGKDIFAHTGNNLVDAVLSVPFQWLFGPTLYAPVFVFVVQVGNAVCFRPLARYVMGEGIAAFAATLLWQINPFVLFEFTAGRPTQGMLWFLPIAVLYFLRSAREPGLGNPLRLGLAMGLTAWTYWFNGYFLAILLLPLAAWELRVASAAGGRGRVVARWLFGAVVCVALLAPGIVGMVGAYEGGRIPGLDASAAGGLFEPPKPVANNVSSALHGLALMEIYGAPLFFQPAWGLPLIVALFYPGLRIPGGRARWVVALLLTLVLALGPVLVLGGGRNIVMPQYMVLYRHLPFFNRLWFPYRLAVMAFIPACLLIAALVARARWPRVALAGLVAAGLGGQAVAGVWPFNWHDARAPRMLEALRPLGGALIFVPFKIQHDGLMWQTRFLLPTFGGMGESASIFWPEKYRSMLNNTFIKQIRGASMNPVLLSPLVPAEREAIEAKGFRWVVVRLHLLRSEYARQAELRGESVDVDVATAASITAMSRVVGSPPAGVDRDSLLWDLKGKWSAGEEFAVTPERIEANTITEAESPQFEVSLKVLGRTGAPSDRPQAPRPR